MKIWYVAKNKKGDERTLSFYWFIILIIVAVALVSGVLNFFSSPIDVREVEANILLDKVIDCFSDKGFLREVESIDDCGLVLEEEEFFVDVSYKDKTLEKGNVDEAFCDFSGSKENIPVCVEKRLFVLDNTDNSFVELNIKAGVRKIEENAR